MPPKKLKIWIPKNVKIILRGKKYASKSNSQGLSKRRLKWKWPKRRSVIYDHNSVGISHCVWNVSLCLIEHFAPGTLFSILFWS